MLPYADLIHDTGRIHFSINYPELDFDSRKIIWTMFFKRSSTDISDEDLSPCLLPHQWSLLTNIDIVLSVLNDWEKATRRGPVVDSEGDIL